ncbi:uncharacterized protein BJY21_002798 [Kineosphaera limosa]|uniref:Asparagine synthetase domain-containing protein n=1 Tax=Kineosphaera limosa NBRC 100340 TaxID=1184609 RepID=K6WZ11_9MICO|nr:ATP-dependent sacrificial sulfur transferase LarE [Kineosphaera limosa]NYE01614.1 uncharacterized protein [Kineosphaera limosa]GAB97312.1 hypothetical protein KILIM_064_00050 [Kineosphaera limosa NBRC 100340]
MTADEGALDAGTQGAHAAVVLRRAQEAIGAQLRGVRRLGVAFSGGVDSSTLVALAARILGPEQVVAVLGVSPSLAADERLAAHKVAAVIGVRVVELATQEGAVAAYAANGPDRCFHCKNELFATISAEVVASENLDAVAYGENADDSRRPDRPGAAAAVAHQVLRPLADAGLTKADVRAIARELGLPCADKPAAPCLASRIPHFSLVTPQKLRQVDRAEQLVRGLGFSDGRVRHHGDIARVELPAAELARATTEPIRRALVDGLLAQGFRYVALDLVGIQSGAFTMDQLRSGHG